MNYQPSHIEEYRTPDLGQAAFLVTLGYPLQRVDGEPGERRRYFVFEPDAARDANSYFCGAHVTAQLYSTALRNLKAQLYPTCK